MLAFRPYTQVNEEIANYVQNVSTVLNCLKIKLNIVDESFWFTVREGLYVDSISSINRCSFLFLHSKHFCFFLHRSVPDNQRSYSLGFQFIFQRSLGLLPGPVLLGWMFDFNCLFWGESCGRRGRCQIYDIWKLSVIITSFGFAMKGERIFLSTFHPRGSEGRFIGVGVEKCSGNEIV